MRSAAPAVELAVELRSLKQGSGLSFARLSQHTHYAKSSWERWVNGKQFPPRTAVESIAALCGSDPGPLLELWERANGERAAANEPGASATAAAEGVAAPSALSDPSGPSGPSAPVASSAPAAPSAPGDATQATDIADAPAEAAVPDTANAADVPDGADVIDTGRVPDGSGTDGADAAGRDEADTDVDVDVPARAQRTRRRRILWGAALASLVVAAAAGIAFSSGLFGHAKAAAQPQPSLVAGPPAGCTGTQCEGKDPKKMNCGADAVTVRTGSIPKDLVIELRYSRACAAAWGRISFAEIGATVVVNNSDGAASANVVHYDRDVYTPLIAAPKSGAVWVCASLPKGGVENCTGRFIPDKEH
ncbi:DUF2690 domain-containing protein [Streptomyces sp. NPDC050485]|uniref:helix-turn-helix domain-containing protein n=1 Tax=Streptomyces sp. NPDC050485 TaxID=3365617 RepID=UPI0037B3C486